MKLIETIQELACIAMTERVGKGKTIVFTNGCYDFIHVAHIRLLSQAKKMGDILFLALNSDNSIRALKGPSRPIYKEEDRITILSALESIDYIYVFDTERCHREILAVSPHIYVKGKGWTIDNLDEDEKAAIVKVGARIEIIDNNDKNSSDIIKQIREMSG